MSTFRIYNRFRITSVWSQRGPWQRGNQQMSIDCFRGDFDNVIDGCTGLHGWKQQAEVEISSIARIKSCGEKRTCRKLMRCMWLVKKYMHALRSQRRLNLSTYRIWRLESPLNAPPPIEEMRFDSRNLQKKEDDDRYAAEKAFPKTWYVVQCCQVCQEGKGEGLQRCDLVGA